MLRDPAATVAYKKGRMLRPLRTECKLRRRGTKSARVSLLFRRTNACLENVDLPMRMGISVTAHVEPNASIPPDD